MEIEQVVAYYLEKRLRDLQLARLRHGVGHVIELRRVVDRAEEAGEVVEEGVVTPADIDLDRMAAGRLHRQALVGVDRLRKVAVPEVEEPDRGAIVLIHSD